MRTALFLVAGLLALAAFHIVGRLYATAMPGAQRGAMLLFGIAWIAVAAFNLWLGVSKAGYTVAEELPIFALIAAVPVIAAALLAWKLG